MTSLLSWHPKTLLVTLLAVAALAVLTFAGVTQASPSDGIDVSVHTQDGVILLSWDYNGAETLDGYLIERKDPADSDWEALDRIPETSTRYLDASAAATGKYKYRVSEVHSAHVTDRLSLSEDGDYALTAPRNLTAFLRHDDEGAVSGVLLSFEDARIPGYWSGFKVYRNGNTNPIDNYYHPDYFTPEKVSDGRVWFRDRTATASDTTYSYRVKVYAGPSSFNTSYYSDLSEAVSVHVPASEKPDAPQNVTAALDTGVVTLSWDDPADDTITGYKVTRRLGDVTETVAENTGSTATTFVDSTAVAGNTYFYRVRAINPHGNGPRAAAVSVTLPSLAAAPAAPQVLLHNGVAEISWDAVDDDTITGYRVVRRVGSSGDWADVASGTTMLGVSDGPLEPDTSYDYAVSSQNAGGNGALSGATTLSVPALPAAPQNLASSQTLGVVVVTWESPDDDTITSLLVTRNLFSRRVDTRLVESASFSVAAGSAEYRDTDIRAGHRTTYTVRAQNPAGNGADSDYHEVRIARPPGAPTGLQASASNGVVTLLWDIPDDDAITGYQILRRVADNGETEMQVLVDDTGNAGITYVDDSAVSNSENVYRVKAIRGAVLGASSRYTTVTP